MEIVPRKPLTDRQRVVYDYIVMYQESYGVFPTPREVGEYLGVQVDAAHDYLNKLEKKGWIVAPQPNKRTQAA